MQSLKAIAFTKPNLSQKYIFFQELKTMKGCPMNAFFVHKSAKPLNILTDYL